MISVEVPDKTLASWTAHDVSTVPNRAYMSRTITCWMLFQYWDLS